MSVAEYLEHWLTVDIERRASRKTAIRHRQIVQRQIAPRLGNVPVRKLTPTHIEAFEAQLQQDGYVKGRRAGQDLTAHKPEIAVLESSRMHPTLFAGAGRCYDWHATGARYLDCVGQTSI